MKNLRRKIKKYFDNPNDPMIEKLSKNDLKYIEEYMNRPTSVKKIQRIELNSDRLVINPGDDEGIAYIRKE